MAHYGGSVCGLVAQLLAALWLMIGGLFSRSCRRLSLADAPVQAARQRRWAESRFFRTLTGRYFSV